MTRLRITVGLFIFFSASLATARGVLEMKNGWEFGGQTSSVPSINAEAWGGSDKGKRVWFADDGLRRVFVPSKQVVNIRQVEELPELIRLPKQKPAFEGPPIGRVGSLLKVTPFDQFGHRTVTIQTPARKVNIVQGITEITPVWTKVQGLKSAQRPYVWDMRVATNSIPRTTLRKIIEKQLDFDDADVRLSLVRLYIESKQFGIAEEELKEAIKKFPDLKKMKNELRELHQLKAKQQLVELELRQSNGQHAFVKLLLEHFPTEDVAQQLLLQAGEMKEAYEAEAELGKNILDSLNQQIKKIANAPEKKLYDAFFRELLPELNHNSLSRLGTYVQLLDAKDLPDDQKRALALSGWILGEQNASNNQALAMSAWRVREIVKEYLITSIADRRTALIKQLDSQEAGAPKYVAQILANMKPPLRTEGLYDRLPEEGEDPPSNLNVGHHFELETTGLTEDAPVKYHVQLPPEYDANRRYPTIVALHGAGGKPEAQLLWWAGAFNKDRTMRTGQASRHGYIVIAPEWTKPKQRKYEYSPAEHAAVLSSLQDALQRFSIDTNRVFLSGHMMGGDAVWDIGVAHPDLWAGVIPISATSEYSGKNSPNYIARYRSNAKQVAFYFLGGALDRATIDANVDNFNHYLQNAGYDTTIVHYLGRGNEDFYEDIHRIFDWMSVHQRDPFRSEIDATIMRPWDNFFYWFEVGGIPNNSIVLPAAWPPKPGMRPMTVTGSVRDKKNVRVTTGTTSVKIFLAPEMVNLEENVKIHVNGRLNRQVIKPSSETMLEDARRRGDRLHPFWVELDLPTGR